MSHWGSRWFAYSLPRPNTARDEGVFIAPGAADPHSCLSPLACFWGAELASQMVKLVLGGEGGGACLAAKPGTSSFICTPDVWPGLEAGNYDPVGP